LRERGKDVLLLAEHFLKHFSVAMNKAITGITPSAQQKLLAHHWPGNVRELRNVIERAVILETAGQIQSANLPDFQLETRLRKTSPGPTLENASLDERLDGYQRELILAMLRRNEFNVTRTAEQLRLTRHQLRHRMDNLGIVVRPGPDEEAAVSPRKTSA
jgi:DNA-binding NtrC family response regulator